MDALTPRKVIAAVTVTALVVVLHFLTSGGLGFLWPIVAASCGAAAGFLTPPEKRTKELPAPPLSGAGRLTNALEGTRYSLHRRDIPAPVDRAWTEFDSSARWVLNNWNRLDDAPSQQSLVRDMIEEHSSALVKSYLQVTNLTDPAAVKEVTEGLGILNREMTEIRDAIAQDSVRSLQDHTMALKLEYGGTLPSVESKEV
ncbi:hypothetical protein ACKFRM_08825 [Corynebacterium sp. YSMAA1_1_D6]|uniref:hypothetical protein n=1 Tax=Corynebacterium sp. YSMAA1_1_D6 TaxID=3383589 RepID=UPI0038D158FB